MELEIDIVLIYFVALLCLLSGHGAFGKYSFVPEQIEEEKVLRPVTKIILSSDGDTFECIDIYQQPAFQHSLLKNHKIHMRPSSYPVDMNSSSTSSGASSSIELPSLDCPSGTIPILRAVGGKNVTSTAYSTPQRVNPFHVADQTSNDRVVRGFWAEYITGGYYYGVKGALCAYEPRLIKGNILSQASISLSNGKGNEFSAAGTGWFVYPELYDGHARLFVFWYDAAKHPSRECINLLCPGFVQVSSTIGLGSKIVPVSQYDGKQFQIDLEIFKDPAKGDWWVAFGKGKLLLGYWPKEVFTSLGDQASIAYWGGYAASYSDVPSPPMGSGHFGSEGFKKAAFVLGMQVMNRNRNFITPLKVNCRGYYFTPECYKSEKIRESAGEWGLNFYYGGPGGCVG